MRPASGNTASGTNSQQAASKGRSRARCVDRYKGLANCTAIFRLPGGNIAAQTTAVPGPAPKELALTGGTGAYRNVGGDGTLVEFGPVLNARYRTSPPAQTMPVMPWIAALAAMVEVDGVAAAPTTPLDFLCRTRAPNT